MREAYAGTVAATNSTPHNRAVQARTIVRNETLTARLMRVAHSVFGVDGITKSLARKTGCAPRTVEYWLANEREMSLETFEKLVAADTKFLDAFMDRLPAAMRERWLNDKILEIKIAKREASISRTAADVAQMKLQLRSER
jgi:transcriptional regulator with XRE-family HTH domain